MINLIEGKNFGKIVLTLFILTNAIYLYMIMVTIPLTMNFSNGMQLLDMKPSGYDFNYVNELFKSLGENGRKTYLTKQIPVDMVYPFLFGSTYSLLMAFFFKKLQKLKPPYSYLCFVPVVAGIADYAENFGIISLLKNYPELLETSVVLTNTFTLIKSVSTSIFFIILLIVLVSLGLQAVAVKNRSL
ncbi:hypothetical protein [Flagellimonas zhangzhouensis]|uniref:Uncharacterized protein n=1 Tax=Flagellimonas zhangzhouensis TaxID=1073328 RepID=A0A1H2QLX9_9FLAO|nr:hypothetical protein [Allomuricauda zhangzhouensis]SDQ54763.1 hypothetical protein SAMN05216294_1634 [Allomuricauda zhangzhouensis]SDW08213.1 hypothetical protein SAMN04487892_0285 [Allomuricauda zhangzhouensis]